MIGVYHLGWEEKGKENERKKILLLLLNCPSLPLFSFSFKSEKKHRLSFFRLATLNLFELGLC